MYKLLVFILFISSISMGSSTHINMSNSHPIYEIEKKLRQGDKNALIEIGEYIDSKKELTIYLGYHILNSDERHIVMKDM